MGESYSDKIIQINYLNPHLNSGEKTINSKPNTYNTTVPMWMWHAAVSNSSGVPLSSSHYSPKHNRKRFMAQAHLVHGTYSICLSLCSHVLPVGRLGVSLPFLFPRPDPPSFCVMQPYSDSFIADGRARERLDDGQAIW